MKIRKSKHFKLSQWNRSIDDFLLEKIFPFIEKDSFGGSKSIAIVYPSFLKRIGSMKDCRKHIVLIINKGVLVTTYWCIAPKYLYSKEPFAYFQDIL